ncbi:putative transcription factor interactor and regulator CCHC(Zn) family [Helianthus debilis subsp. tardiflorus]
MGDGPGPSVTLISKLDIGSPLYLHPSDSSALTIVNLKLKGTENYTVWASAMKLALEAKNKYGFIDGKCVKPKDDDVLSAQWDRCNSVFDAMLHLPSCSCQAAKDYNDFSTLIKLMQFLMGLDDVYQPVRTNLLTREPFPSVKVAFSIISREESHRLSSGGSKAQNVSFVSKPNQVFDPKRRNNRGPNPNLKCSHCNMIGHTIDRCFEIVGYPPGFKRRGNSNQANKTNPSINNNSKSNNVGGSSVSTGSSLLPFTSEQISKLLSLVGEKSGSNA